MSSLLLLLLSLRRYDAALMKMMMKPHMMPKTKWFVLEMIHHGGSDPFA